MHTPTNLMDMTSLEGVSKQQGILFQRSGFILQLGHTCLYLDRLQTQLIILHVDTRIKL